MKKLFVLFMLSFMLALTFTSCEKDDYAEYITPHLTVSPISVFVGDTITFDMSKSIYGNGSCFGTSFDINSWGSELLPFDSIMIRSYVFNTPGNYTIIGYAHNEDHMRESSTQDIVISPIPIESEVSIEVNLYDNYQDQNIINDTAITGVKFYIDASNSSFTNCEFHKMTIETINPPIFLRDFQTNKGLFAFYESGWQTFRITVVAKDGAGLDYKDFDIYFKPQ